MNEQPYSEEYIPGEETVCVAVVETIDAITGKTIFLAMADDTSKFVGQGEDCEEAIIDLEAKMYDVDEYDDTPWECQLAS